MSIETDKNHCRIATLEAVLKFFDKPNNFVRNINSISSLITYLETNNLKCVVSCPIFFIFSPRLWQIFFSHRVSVKKFLELGNENRRKVIMHFLSAQQLYDIDDFWTHYVCEFFEEKYVYFDPYLDNLTIDYPSKKGYKLPSSTELFQKKSIKILIFESQ